jgi:predicted nucleic acid-binding protein
VLKTLLPNPDASHSQALLARLQAVQLVAPALWAYEVTSALALEWTLRLQRASAYDSFYLAIAESLQAPFWSADRRLVNAFQQDRPAWLHGVWED